ncbi:hypothetical protein SAMN02949497_1235 [Methylomagnum ishizawai]|uniref:Uncharacterized protein n=1 Tax=Methylomagnum ishizawai TaxID=1760988 RepID=A0A1Y6CTG5_9GAMM|nr:hypothetical protein [Methylomagnum ishizawai]SMF93939.1 hypothetical protein SAMN02949497_1235 [Methylomagnum ishizawai]
MKMPFPDRSLPLRKSMVIPVLFLKTHVRGYYRNNGGYWSSHERNDRGGFGHPPPHARLAPNGKPSNLNESQWNLVRTPEFKVWFGDWEIPVKSAYITSLSIPGWQGDLKILQNMARRVYAERLQGHEILNLDMNRKIRFTAEGKGESFSGIKAPMDAQVVEKLAHLVRRAVWLDKNPPDARRVSDTEAFHTFVAPLKVNGNLYAVKLTVRESLAGPPEMARLKLYDVAVLKSKVEDPVGPGLDTSANPAEVVHPSHSGSTVTIHRLLSVFNGVNLKHVPKLSGGVDANGEPMPKAILEYMSLHKAQPTAAQIQAGNYKKGHRRFRGLDISIENPAGSTRSGTDPDGHAWSIKMKHDYGYIRGSLGVAPDGDPVDVYVGPDEDAESVYIVHQRKAGNWKDWDEDKCMIGFPDKESAVAAYLGHYDDPRFLGPVTTMPFAEFKDKVLDHSGRPKMIKSIPLLFVRAAA